MNLEELDALSQKVAKALYIIENLKLERTSLSQRAETAEQQLESKEAELQEQVLKIEEQALKIEEQASQLEEQTTQIESLNTQLEEGNNAQAAILSEAQERLQGMLTALDSLDFDPATETTESDEVVEPAMESEIEPVSEDESYEQELPAHESIELESMEEPSEETASVEVEPAITDAGDLFGQLDQVILESEQSEQSEQSEAPEGEFVETTLTGEQVSEEVPQFVEETYETYQLEEEESPEPSAQYETEEVLEVPTYHQNSETTQEWTDDWDEEVAPRHNDGPSIQEDSVYSEDEN